MIPSCEAVKTMWSSKIHPILIFESVEKLRIPLYIFNCTIQSQKYPKITSNMDVISKVTTKSSYSSLAPLETERSECFQLSESYPISQTWTNGMQGPEMQGSFNLQSMSTRSQSLKEFVRSFCESKAFHNLRWLPIKKDLSLSGWCLNPWIRGHSLRGIRIRISQPVNPLLHGVHSLISFPPQPLLLKKCGAPRFFFQCGPGSKINNSKITESPMTCHWQRMWVTLNAGDGDIFFAPYLMLYSFFGELWAMSCSKFLGDCWKSPYQEPLIFPSLPLEKKIAITQEQFNDFTINEKEWSYPNSSCKKQVVFTTAT